MKCAKACLVQIAKQPRVLIDSPNDIKDNCPFSREIWGARRSTRRRGGQGKVRAFSAQVASGREI